MPATAPEVIKTCILIKKTCHVESIGPTSFIASENSSTTIAVDTANKTPKAINHPQCFILDWTAKTTTIEYGMRQQQKAIIHVIKNNELFAIIKCVILVNVLLFVELSNPENPPVIMKE